MGESETVRLPRRSRQEPKADFSIVPKGSAGCVVVLHEVWGLVAHTEDVCKRVSKLGFAATAPDLYRGYGQLLTPDNIQKTMEGVWDLSLEERRDRTKVAETLAKKGLDWKIMEVAAVLYDQHFRDELLDRAVAAVDRAHERFGEVAVLGFCIGGGLALKAATRSRHLRATVSFYGAPPTTMDVKKIRRPVLAIHAMQDEIINQSVPAFVGAMLEEGKDLTLKTYPKTRHGFFNDTRKTVYNRGAAEQAWDITKRFLDRNLGRH
jgi:carboxymethylenebutenolidase